MSRLRKYECPSCLGSFEVLHRASEEMPPRFCQLCGYTEAPLIEPLPAPYISSAAARSVDGHHRAMEEGAEFRAQHAMETHGLDAQAAAALKLPQTQDRLREGDIAAAPVQNDISRAMDSAPAGTWGYTGGGIGYSGAVAQGAFPNAGLRALQNLRSAHQQFTSAAGHAGATTSNTPALEVLNPSYRARI